MNRRPVLVFAGASVAAAAISLCSVDLFPAPSVRRGVWAEEPSGGDGAQKLPPLVVDKKAPLLLDDPSDNGGKTRSKALAINDACFVCHANYDEEPLVVMHAEAEVGCADCHGASLEHRNDEDNVTPPDTMYPRERIDEACQECHETHDAPARAVLARWQERCPERKDFATIVCTDCHGQHRLATRVVRWNKKTGALIIRSTDDKNTVEKKRSSDAED
jgi:hypothetical protein